LSRLTALGHHRELAQNAFGIGEAKLGRWWGTWPDLIKQHVAVGAPLIGVSADGVHGALGFGVTLQALRGRALVLAERVAVLAARRQRTGVERRHH
jgi:hypothetical protein